MWRRMGANFEEQVMANDETKVPVKTTSTTPSPFPELFDWHPLDQLRRQINSLLHELPSRRNLAEIEPFDRFFTGWPALPAVDLVEKDDEYRISAELPGLDEKNVEVKLSGGVLTISGEKKDEREEKEKGYSFSERRYGAFKRGFRVPDGVDTDKVSASFAKGVLTVVLPKTAGAKRAEKKIDIKPA
jgi:HSP20 family protein